MSSHTSSLFSLVFSNIRRCISNAVAWSSPSHYTKLINLYSWEGKPNIYTYYRATGCRSQRSLLLSPSIRRSTGPGKDERFLSSCKGRRICGCDHRPIPPNARGLRTALQVSVRRPIVELATLQPQLHTYSWFLLYFTSYNHSNQLPQARKEDTPSDRGIERFYSCYRGAWSVSVTIATLFISYTAYYNLEDRPRKAHCRASRPHSRCPSNQRYPISPWAGYTRAPRHCNLFCRAAGNLRVTLSGRTHAWHRRSRA
jgi:hypothetical protein